MTPYIVQLPLGDDPPTAKLYYGRPVLDALLDIDDNSAHVICTSPPYWGLRDYGVSPQEWPEMTFPPMAGVPEMVVPAQTVALGLEPDPMHYIGHLVMVCRELRRVLRDDGTFWINLGDSYASSSPGNKTVGDIKPKDLALMPHRGALALQADGWWVRSDIVWAKGFCMPEPVKDRCTRSHESVFMLAKSSRYFYDIDAVRVPHKAASLSRYEYGLKNAVDPDAIPGSVHDRVTKGLGNSERMGDFINMAGRNKRTVWDINPRPYPGAHFAVWPPALVEPMIKAGTSERGVCDACGAPWRRIPEKGAVGWEPTCKCEDAGVGRPVVLDPFSGSATTGMVALKLGRDYIGIDLQDNYLKLAEARLVGRKAPQDADDEEEGDIFNLFG